VNISIIFVLSLVGLATLFYVVVVRRDKTRERKAAWRHVVEAIEGTYQDTKIRGTHQGKSVEVFLNNGGYEIDIYSYFIRLKVPIQGFDWRVDFIAHSRTLEIRSDEEELKDKLAEAGLITLIQSVSGHPQVRYRADKGTIEYEMLVGDDSYVPSADEFQTQLNLLTQLAELNSKLNVW